MEFNSDKYELLGSQIRIRLDKIRVNSWAMASVVEQIEEYKYIVR